MIKESLELHSDLTPSQNLPQIVEEGENSPLSYWGPALEKLTLLKKEEAIKPVY